MPLTKDSPATVGVAEEVEARRPQAATHATEAAGPASASVMLLRLLRAAQPVSRAELARRLGVNRSTVTDTFKPLIAAGVVREEAVQPSRQDGARALGRPAVALSFDDGQDYFAGVNVGVRHSTVGLATINGEVLAEEEFDTPSEPGDALRRVVSVVERLRGRARGRKLRMVGVSVPGPTDATRRRVVYAPHLGWDDVDLAGALCFGEDGAECGTESAVPVAVENDATAAALYEAHLRLGRAESGRLEDFVLVRSGTGIGLGLVLGGEVYRGGGLGAGHAGEFGHMTIVAGGKPCVCGNRGCWERYASASSASALYVGDRVQLGGQAAPRFVEIVARAEAGELRAQRTLERVGEYLGIGIANVITGLGVPRVIVSGRLVYGWKFISEPLRGAVAQSMAGRLSGWSVEPGEASGAGLGGALEVAVEGFITSGLGV
ncbi:MAG TPA: ROK family transcriptional regulator [Pyrinomonadaceae bacterium]|nr:ROK family transcriptional regulator [Pyrinomonadaceae bacterium]